MNIILFDMDGVLLESQGYHLALQETVRRIALTLHFTDVTLSQQDIATFESGGITSEWDEAAICAAGLLLAAWETDPDVALPSSLDGSAIIRLVARAPDFGALARTLTAPALLSLNPLERADRYFLGLDNLTSAQSNTLRELLRTARDFQCSLTHRTFQELVLGSAEFSRTYGLPAQLDCESYLSKFDMSNLTRMESARLNIWTKKPGQSAVIITSRPSRPPAGVFSTPEAEMGAVLVGLENIPILGWGGITWLGKLRTADPQDYLKPSPVHALACLRMALGADQQTSLVESVLLVETGRVTPVWKQLEAARVSIFEDTPSGIISLSRAREILSNAGITIDIEKYGIAKNPIKKKALTQLEAAVFPDLSHPLNELLDQ